MMKDEKGFSIALPGEWALRKVLGPTLEEFGEDLKALYSKGRDNIIAAASRKIKNSEDGKRANLRVARDVLWNGAFTDDEMCAEYFGGVLAASRSEDGTDDDAIQFVDVIKSMSSSQLRLHYIIYNRLNHNFVSTRRKINVGQGSEIQRCEIWFSTVEMEEHLRLRLDRDPNVLHRMGLLWQYKTDNFVKNNRTMPYFMVSPTVFGVLLYAAVHNKLGEWRAFNSIDFGELDGLKTPKYASETKEGLAIAAGLIERQTH